MGRGRAARAAGSRRQRFLNLLRWQIRGTGVLVVLAFCATCAAGAALVPVGGLVTVAGVALIVTAVALLPATFLFVELLRAMGGNR